MTAITGGEPILVWPDGAPGSEDWTNEEQLLVNPHDGAKVLRNVAKPTLTPYLPDPAVATGTAVIVAPGGGFHVLAYEHEGTQVAEWLAERGIAAFVLHYRVQPTPPDEAEYALYQKEVFGDRGRLWEVTERARAFGVADGQEAIRIVRRRAAEWGVTPDRIGIMGFSAGGYVTLGAAYSHDAETRPDFVGPIYPAPFEGTVPDDAPPMFLACACDDQMAVGSSQAAFKAWRDSGKSVELHIFAKGGHGFGMRDRGLPADHWIEMFGNWLVGEGLVAKPA